MPLIDEIIAAHTRIGGSIRQTPLLNAPLFDEIFGRQVFIKAECLQITGSFKLRGAMNAVASLSSEERKRGVVAFSSGNHAQAVAYAARCHNAKATIIMPNDAPRIKIENTKAYGAEVILYDRMTEDRDKIGEELSNKNGVSLIRPFDDLRVIAGQGTVGYEIARDLQDKEISEAHILCCTGGGGLTAGIAEALHHALPKTQVFACEPQGFDDTARSLITGKREVNALKSGSICDAIITPSPGHITFPILQAHNVKGLTASDESCIRAMAFAFKYFKIVVEPGGAIALAAALENSLPGSYPIVVTASGGNVDAEIFAKALASV